jgi:hypothetical protein
MQTSAGFRFGADPQPRQEDLLEYLHSLLGSDMSAEDLAELQIQLQP